MEIGDVYIHIQGALYAITEISDDMVRLSDPYETFPDYEIPRRGFEEIYKDTKDKGSLFRLAWTAAEVRAEEER